MIDRIDQIDMIDIPTLDKHWMVTHNFFFSMIWDPHFFEQERQYPSCTAVELQT